MRQNNGKNTVSEKVSLSKHHSNKEQTSKSNQLKANIKLYKERISREKNTPSAVKTTEKTIEKVEISKVDLIINNIEKIFESIERSKQSEYIFSDYVQNLKLRCNYMESALREVQFYLKKHKKN
jgi:hypothetical protein